MPSIKARVDSLAALVRKRAQIKAIPYESLDPLSQGLWDYANELKALDAKGKAALLAELNQDGGTMTTEDLERMIRSITVSY